MDRLITPEQAKKYITHISGKNFSFRQLKSNINRAVNKDQVLQECKLAFTIPPKSKCFKWIRLKANFERNYREDFARMHQFNLSDCTAYRFTVNDGRKFFEGFGKMVQDGVIKTDSLHDTANKLIHSFILDYEKKTIINKVHDYFNI